MLTIKNGSCASRRDMGENSNKMEGSYAYAKLKTQNIRGEAKTLAVSCPPVQGNQTEYIVHTAVVRLQSCNTQTECTQGGKTHHCNNSTTTAVAWHTCANHFVRWLSAVQPSNHKDSTLSTSSSCGRDSPAATSTSTAAAVIPPPLQLLSLVPSAVLGISPGDKRVAMPL